jgi:hypothetical protein
MTPEQLQDLDAFVLEAFIQDPLKDAGSVAADATLENLIPGRVICFQDVMESKKRQEIVREVETPVFTQKKGEGTMIRRPEEEKEKLLEFCVKHYEECTAIELTDLINKKKIASEPVNVGYVRYLLKGAPKASKKASKRGSGAKRGRPAGGSIKAREVALESEFGVKNDQEKLPWHLVCWDFFEGIVKVLQFGAKKYAPDNWKKVPNRRDRYMDANTRHWVDYCKGIRVDPETGLSPLLHIGCNLMFLFWMDLTGDEGK